MPRHRAGTKGNRVNQFVQRCPLVKARRPSRRHRPCGCDYAGERRARRTRHESLGNATAKRSGIGQEDPGQVASEAGGGGLLLGPGPRIPFSVFKDQRRQWQRSALVGTGTPGEQADRVVPRWWRNRPGQRSGPVGVAAVSANGAPPRRPIQCRCRRRSGVAPQPAWWRCPVGVDGLAHRAGAGDQGSRRVRHAPSTPASRPCQSCSRTAAGDKVRQKARPARKQPGPDSPGAHGAVRHAGRARRRRHRLDRLRCRQACAAPWPGRTAPASPSPPPRRRRPSPGIGCLCRRRPDPPGMGEQATNAAESADGGWSVMTALSDTNLIPPACWSIGFILVSSQEAAFDPMKTRLPHRAAEGR